MINIKEGRKPEFKTKMAEKFKMEATGHHWYLYTFRLDNLEPNTLYYFDPVIRNFPLSSLARLKDERIFK